MTSQENASKSPRVETIVNRRIEPLQAAFLAGGSTARAQMAQLRHAAREEPGTSPSVWELTSYPVSELAPDAPTPEERAVHDAMCLYAIAQQGNSYGVHEPRRRSNRVGFGDAVRLLAWQGGQEETRFRRRFNATVTSDSYDELVTHVTALIRQIFSSKLSIKLDFGVLAKDLRSIQYPDGANQVRRRWARQYASSFELGDPAATQLTSSSQETLSAKEES